jgi:beta-amylase
MALFPVNVMAPLYVRDSELSQFKADLELARASGVKAVTVDVWWCLVKAAGPESHDWSYYDRIFELILKARLRIVPIIAFHEFGVDELNEDDVPVGLIPDWAWDLYDGRPYMGLYLTKEDLRYKSELGNTSTEAISLWVDRLFLGEYVSFMKAFEKQYAHLSSQIDEINISCGPTGELRYPSYNYHDRWRYPHRGHLQCYSRPAIIDFRENMIRKYGSVSNVGLAWDLYLAGEHSINLPESIDDFLWYSAYRTRYGMDVFEWYNLALIHHGRRMIRAGIQGFSRQFKQIPLGIKIPGIHWNIAHPHIPRISEILAGVINTHIDEGSMAAGHGYAPIMKIVSEVAAEREVILHFTCLEQDNRDLDQGLYAYSRAKSLVSWVAEEAHRQGVTIKGENAMGLTADEVREWDRIASALSDPLAPYHGFTLLRIQQLRHSPYSLRRISEIARNPQPD